MGPSRESELRVTGARDDFGCEGLVSGSEAGTTNIAATSPRPATVTSVATRLTQLIGAALLVADHIAGMFASFGRPGATEGTGRRPRMTR